MSCTLLNNSLIQLLLKADVKINIKCIVKTGAWYKVKTFIKYSNKKQEKRRKLIIHNCYPCVYVLFSCSAEMKCRKEVKNSFAVSCDLINNVNK